MILPKEEYCCVAKMSSKNLMSIVEYQGSHDNYKCGYCKSSNSNYSNGMWAHSLTVSDYQDLIDRGWRRSGHYCYKPTMDAMCCPSYTIRCKALEFKPSKSQKKVLKRFHHHLTSSESQERQAGDNRKMSTCSSEGEWTGEGTEGGEQFVEPTKEHQNIDVSEVKRIVNEQEIKDAEESKIKGDIKVHCATEVQKEIPGTNKSKDVKKGSGADPQRAPCKKAKQLRMERKREKLKDKVVDLDSVSLKSNKNREKQLEDFINELPDESKNKLEIKLVRTAPPSSEWLATATETYEVYVKYQTIVHNDRPERYSQFKNFLVKSPLLEEYTAGGPPCGYGSFHQQYWLEGKLVAVGVIDILPKCVSSVYFFYNPQYMHLTLGTYGALREIAFTRQLQAVAPQLKYYYLGFFIYSCPKMRYKGNFSPSALLCPETYKWFPLTDCIQRLKASAYSRFDPDMDSIDENMPSQADIGNIPIWLNGTVMRLKTYKERFSNGRTDEDELVTYAKLVGAQCVKRLILVK